MIGLILLTIAISVAAILASYYTRWLRLCKRVGVRGPVPYPWIGHIKEAASPVSLYSILVE